MSTKKTRRFVGKPARLLPILPATALLVSTTPLANGGPRAEPSRLPNPTSAVARHSSLVSHSSAQRELLRIPPAADFGFARRATDARPVLHVHAGPLLAGPANRSARNLLSPADASGQITLDSTLGNSNAGSISPVNDIYTIAPRDGRLIGGNLFYSFSSFNIAQGQTASFLGPANPVRFVLARITGASPSSIDGTLQCGIPSADFYLINPNGLIFGPHSSLDLQGSFVATTADYLSLGTSGGRFAATHPESSALTNAAPAAFGFAGAAPAAVGINGAQLQAATGKAILIVGGRIQINSATLDSPAGRVGLASSASAGEFAFDPTTLQLTGAEPPTRGEVDIAANSVISLDGSAGGAFQVRASSLTLDTSSITSTTTGAEAGQGIDIGLDGPLTVANGRITSDTAGIGAGGAIRISSGYVLMTGGNTPNNQSGIFTVTRTGTNGGDAGSIFLNAASLHVLTGAEITSSTAGSGNGGNVNINIAGGVILDVRDSTSAGLTGIATVSNSPTAGAAGSLLINAGALQILNGAEISASTFGLGKGGDLKINVSGDALVSGTDSENHPSGIFANSQSQSLGGDAGSIMLSAGTLRVLSGGEISSSTFGSGKGADVRVSVTGDALLSGTDPTNNPSGIVAASYLQTSGGNAGSVTFSAGSLHVLSGAEMSSSTFGSGSGGSVNVNVTGAVVLNLQNSTAPHLTGFAAVSDSAATGDAGSLAINAGRLQVLKGAEISASTLGSGKGGDVSVSVSGNAILSGVNSRTFNSSGVFSNSESSVGNAGGVTFAAKNLKISGGAGIGSLTRALVGAANGGDVTVEIPGRLIVSGGNGDTSGLTTDALGEGNAGTIKVTAGRLQLLDGGRISSTASAYPGRGGNINITVSGRALLSGAGNVLGSPSDSGVFAYAIPYSTGSSGDAGSITLTAGSLYVLGGARIDSSTLGAGSAGSVSVIVSGAAIFSGTDLGGGGSDLSASSSPLAAGAISGNAGTVTLSAASIQVLAGARLDCSATQAQAGDVAVSSGSILQIAGATLTASSGRDGGNVILRGAHRLLVSNSVITGHAGGNGGQISLTAPTVGVGGSLINGLSANRPVQVAINGKRILISGSQILTDQPQHFPVYDPSGFLAPLRTPLDVPLLQNVCSLDLDADVSSFIVTSRGGEPPAPGGWMPDLDLWIPSSESRENSLRN